MKLLRVLVMLFLTYKRAVPNHRGCATPLTKTQKTCKTLMHPSLDAC